MKKYENVTVKIDEDGSYISISEYGSPVASYRITTDEEKEYLQDRYASKAISSLTFFRLPWLSLRLISAFPIFSI